MKVAIQINSYKGDGSKLETEYLFGELEIKDKPKESTVFFYRPYDESIRTVVKFNLNEFGIDELGIRVKGTNIDGYGKVDLYAGTESSCIWGLAGVAQQEARLMKIYKDTPKYYEENYGDIADINKRAREQYDGERIFNHKESIRELEKK